MKLRSPDLSLSLSPATSSSSSGGIPRCSQVSQDIWFLVISCDFMWFLVPCSGSAPRPWSSWICRKFPEASLWGDVQEASQSDARTTSVGSLMPGLPTLSLTHNSPSDSSLVEVKRKKNLRRHWNFSNRLYLDQLTTNMKLKDLYSTLLLRWKQLKTTFHYKMTKL